MYIASSQVGEGGRASKDEPPFPNKKLSEKTPNITTCAPYCYSFILYFVMNRIGTKVSNLVNLMLSEEIMVDPIVSRDLGGSTNAGNIL